MKINKDIELWDEALDKATDNMARQIAEEEDRRLMEYIDKHADNGSNENVRRITEDELNRLIKEAKEEAIKEYNTICIKDIEIIL